MENLTPVGGDLVVAWYGGDRPLRTRTFQAIIAEFTRNGRRTLSSGKLRWIKRQVRKKRRST